MSNKEKQPDDKNVEQIEYQETLFNNNDAFDCRPRKKIVQTGRGRRKGIQNNTTKDMKQYCVDVIGFISPEQTALDIMNMGPYDRQRIVLGYMDFVVPKMQRIMVEPDQDPDKVIVVKLPIINDKLRNDESDE